MSSNLSDDEALDYVEREGVTHPSVQEQLDELRGEMMKITAMVSSYHDGVIELQARHYQELKNELGLRHQAQIHDLVRRVVLAAFGVEPRDY